MKSILLIRIPPPTAGVDVETTVHWAEYSGNGELQGDVHVAKLSGIKQGWLAARGAGDTQNDQAFEDLLPDQVVLLLPGTMTLHRELAINSGQKKHINTALPFMIEEDLAEDVDALHLASQLRNEKDKIIVSGIAHNLLQGILATLDEQGLNAHHVLAEMQFVNTGSCQLSIILEHHSVIMQASGEPAYNLDYDALHFVLGQPSQVLESGLTHSGLELDEQPPASITSVNLYFSEGISAVDSDVKDKVLSWLDEQGWLIEEQPFEETVFEYLARHYFEKRKKFGALVDLRSGAYQCPRRANRRLKRWKPIALVASLWLMLEMGLMIGEGVAFQRQAGDFWDQSAELYLQVFPQDQQVKEALAVENRSINVKSRMESRLKSAGNNPGSKPFLPLLQQVSSVSASLPEAKIKPLSMDFNDTSGNLVLELRAESLEAVDKLLAATRSSGLSAKLDSANQEKNGVNARMTISR